MYELLHIYYVRIVFYLFLAVNQLANDIKILVISILKKINYFCFRTTFAPSILSES